LCYIKPYHSGCLEKNKAEYFYRGTVGRVIHLRYHYGGRSGFRVTGYEFRVRTDFQRFELWFKNCDEVKNEEETKREVRDETHCGQQWYVCLSSKDLREAFVH